MNIKNTVMGSLIGGAVGLGIGLLHVARDMSAPVSYPFTGALIGIGAGVKVADKANLAANDALFVMGVSAVSGAATGTLLIPVAPAVLLGNLLTLPLVTVVGAGIGGFVGSSKP